MSEKILIVDDEQEIAQLLQIYLQNDGYTVRACSTGKEALSVLESFLPDLALLDIMLPDMDGFSLCGKIREQYFFPVIMLTARVSDGARLAAALLVVAIHTGPLSSFTTVGDLLLTRGAARLAVLFFFAVSGFFLLPQGSIQQFKRYLQHMFLLYGAATLLYLPAALYTGYFTGQGFLPQLLKALLFDGVFYHLWYLPAALLGAGIAWWLWGRLGRSGPLAAAGVLYLVGLLGDSYFGVAQALPVLRDFYGQLFQVFSYMRNGLFFAPLFFLLGGRAAIAKEGPLWKAVAGFLTSLVLLCGECLLVHGLGLPRHDSMLLSLVPCVWFLLRWLGRFQGKRRKRLAQSSMLVYLLHPFNILGVRFLARLLGLRPVLVENSLIHYGMVCLLSLLEALALTALWRRLPHGSPVGRNCSRSWIELDLQALAHNLQFLQSRLFPSCQLMAVVKDNAYGHGAQQVAKECQRLGVESFAVSTLEEGAALRKRGIRGEVLILGYTDPRRVKEIKKYNLTQTLISLPYAQQLEGQGVKLQVHIKLDTGMHRLGISWDGLPALQEALSLEHLQVSGIFTHLCCAGSSDPEDRAFTSKQIQRFYQTARPLQEQAERLGRRKVKLHLLASDGILQYPGLPGDCARPGLALYGVGNHPELRPVLAMKSQVVLLRRVPTGDTAGYGRAFRAQRDTVLAVLPLGYGDGYPRALSGKGQVLIRGKPAPVVGRICMDQLTVDVTDIPEAALGDTAILVDNRPGSPLSAEAVAGHAGTIPNELLCRLGERLPRVWISS